MEEITRSINASWKFELLGCDNLYETGVYRNIKKCFKVLNNHSQYKLQKDYLVDKPWRQFTTRYNDRDYKCVLGKSCRSRKVRRKINTKAEDIVSWIERWPVAFSFDEDYISEKFRIKV